jgi:hypothetical protein
MQAVLDEAQRLDVTLECEGQIQRLLSMPPRPRLQLRLKKALSLGDVDAVRTNNTAGSPCSFDAPFAAPRSICAAVTAARSVKAAFTAPRFINAAFTSTPLPSLSAPCMR